jgi:serine/threonine protein kinase
VVKVSRTSKLDERRVREAREDLENECRILTSMGPHHHVVELRGVVFEDDPPFLGLVLAFYALGSMKTVFKAQELPLRTKVKVLYGIGLGIAYLHKNGVEHRDLWPANVLLDADFTAKLADFGLAITRHSRKIPNKCQFRWSSPQRCANHLSRANRYEPKNDVWSFGMICYWALTGFKPYKDIEKGNEVRYELERGATPKFADAAELPVALVEAIQCCWIFQTADRPPMAEVCGRLARVLERDSALLGDDHPDAGPVDRTAWKALMPGAKKSASPLASSSSSAHIAASRESSHATRLRSLDADIELLKQRRAALQEHYKLISRAPDAAKSKKAKKLLEAERATIAQRMEAEIAACDAEIEHKTDRRTQLAATASKADSDAPTQPPVAVKSATTATTSSSSSSHRHRRSSSGASNRPLPAQRVPSKLGAVADEPSHDAVNEDSDAAADDDDAGGDSDDDDDDDDDDEQNASTSASDDGKPQPLGAYTRAVVATRDEPASDSDGLALVKGAQIYLLHRGATSSTLEGVDVAVDKRGSFPKVAVRGVSRRKEEEIARAFGQLRKRKRTKVGAAKENSDSDAADSSASQEIAPTELPEPVVFQRRPSASSDGGGDHSYADAITSEYESDSASDDVEADAASSSIEHIIESRVRVLAVSRDSDGRPATGTMQADDGDDATADDETD